VRLENDVLVTEKGTMDLMANIPLEADEIESLMEAKVEATNGHNGRDGHDGHQTRPLKRPRLAPVKG